MEQNTPEALRAEADRIDNEAALANKGKVYIFPYTGSAHVHNGRKESNPHPLLEVREATHQEISALCVIPEFAAYLKKVRGEA